MPGILDRLFPTDISPYGQLLPQETSDALRNQALLQLGSSLLSQGSNPVPYGQRPGLLASVGNALQGIDWPGRVNQAGEAAMKMGSGADPQVQAILASVHGSEGDPHQQLKAIRDAASQLVALGSPAGLQAAEQLSKLEKLYSEALPARGTIQWRETTDPKFSPDGKTPVQIAIDPTSGKYVPDPDDPTKPWVLAAGVPTPGGLTESQRIQYEGQLTSQALPNLVRYADLEGQFRAFLDSPMPETSNARSIWLRQAQNLIGAVTPQTAGDSTVIGTLLSMISDKLGKVAAGQALSANDMAAIRKMVEDMHEKNRESGRRLYSGYVAQATRLGLVSDVLRAFEGTWGSAGLSKKAEALIKLGEGE